MNYVGADCQASWRAIGQQLKVEDAFLDAIQLETAGNPNASIACMSKVFRQWYSGMTCEYSWKKLAEVLLSHAVEKPLQVEKVYSELTKKN